MNIFISKNGQKLGPYAVEAARAMVLAGTVKANDWAWIDGATDWIPLNQIPGFTNYQAPTSAVSTASPITAPVAPNSPIAFVCSTHEEELWKGSPSQWLNLKVNVIWALIFVGLFVLSKIVRANVSILPELPPNLFGLTTAVLAPICLVHCAWRAIKLFATRYTITNQRARVIRGILSRDVQEIELFRVKDIAVHQTLFLRLFGLGNVRIVSSDAANQVIFLRAVPNALNLREKIRKEVFVLRQRLAAREVEIMQGN